MFFPLFRRYYDTFVQEVTDIAKVWAISQDPSYEKI
jgi:hypothetical protein